MERELPVLRKHYLLYSEYAGVVMKDVFYGFAEQVKPLEAEHLASAICYGDGKGGFTLTDLPSDLQLAPIFSFRPIGNNEFLCGGNFFETIPYEGRYDAQPLALFSNDRKRTVHYLSQPQLSGLKEEVRDLQWVRVAGNKEVLMVAGNNVAPLFYQTTKP